MKPYTSKRFKEIIKAKPHELMEVILSGTKEVRTFKTNVSKLPVKVFVKGSIEFNGDTYTVGVANA
jgi:hypothetical protein